MHGPDVPHSHRLQNICDVVVVVVELVTEVVEVVMVLVVVEIRHSAKSELGHCFEIASLNSAHKPSIAATFWPEAEMPPTCLQLPEVPHLQV